MERFTCINSFDNLYVPRELVQELHITSAEEFHLRADLIAEAARRMEKGGWIRLPFCNTLCSEALGAKATLTLSGARIKEPTYCKVNELPDTLSVSTPRLMAMLQALEILASEEQRVVYNVEGPLTILCSLLPMNRVFSMLRKPAGVDMLKKAEDLVSAYTALVIKRGAQMISFADPVATTDILGPHIFSSIYFNFLKNLLERLKSECAEVPIHLCGKLTQCMVDIDGCSLEPWYSKGGLTYGQALTDFCKCEHGGILGHFCLHFLDAKRRYVTLVKF